MIREMFKDHPELLPKECKDIESYLAMMKSSLPKQYAAALEDQLPADLRGGKFGTDSDKYLTYYRENLEFLGRQPPILIGSSSTRTPKQSDRRIASSNCSIAAFPCSNAKISRS